MLPTASAQTSVQQRENTLIRELSLPSSRPAAAPTYRPAPRPTAPVRRAAPAQPANQSPRPAAGRSPATSPARPPAAANPPATANPPTAQPEPTYQHVIKFNRSPVVGNRLRLEGVYPTARLGFNRPRQWDVKSSKLVLRFQHSPSLLSDRSSLTVRVNDTSVGSVPLNRPKSQIGQVVFDVPSSLIQDYNEVSILAEQQTSEDCTVATDPTLWTEILPDSEIILDYALQSVPLDFSRYPFPFIDNLSLDPNQITYLRPRTYSETWLNAAAIFQAEAGRLVDFRPLNTRLIDSLDNLQWNDRIVILGTPTEQPALSELSLPFPLRNGQLLDGNNTPLPGEVGVLMLTTLKENGLPVLVATGNSAVGVQKAVQFLVQTQEAQIGTGQVLTVTNLADAPSPAPREWPGYLPTRNSFTLRDLTTAGGQNFEDITVHGTNSPPIQIPFRALPDDRFSRGSRMKLDYSYSAQVDPRTSTVEVRLDDVTIGSKRLNAAKGGRDSLDVDLPADLIQPDSQLNVVFNLNPRSAEVCGLSKDQSLWGTLHGDTDFSLKRDIFTRMPDLKLLQTGYPFTAPQDLSETAFVVPSAPRDADVRALLAVSERFGRLSRASSVNLQVYTGGTLPAETRDMNLVGIGTRDRFPLPEAFETSGFGLGNLFSRSWNGSRVQALPDSQGVVKLMVSPTSSDRAVLAITGQNDQGLGDAAEVFKRDPLFSQLNGDTILVSRNKPNPAPNDPYAYKLDILQETQPQQVQKTGFLSRISIFIQDHWFLLPTGMILMALLLYGISQIYVNRLPSQER
ncbi:MAG: cellulose biosynthesis cyclic di-GMP-binding regulatory protein BcsB [Cyanobacteria bacterium J069]